VGTSDSYSGPGKNSPLLPSWAQSDDVIPPEDSGAPETESPDSEIEERPESDDDQGRTQAAKIDLSQARRWLRRYAISGDLGNLARASRSYVRGMGGPRNAARSARAGRSTIKKLGRVFSDLALGGTPVAFDRLDIAPVVGRPLEEVLASIQDFLAPAGSSMDEAAARNAVSATLRDVYQQYDLEGAGLDGLNAIDEQGVRSTLELFAANYIYERMLNAMYNDLTGEDVDEVQLVRMERDIRAFTREAVRLELDDVEILTVDWDGKQGDEIATRIFEQAYAVWEAMRL
jgi:hypothetical protein